MCTFEHVYFRGPIRRIFGKSVNESRHKMGKRLAIEASCRRRLSLIPVPDSGRCRLDRLRAQSGISFRQAIIRNHYVGRTFIRAIPIDPFIWGKA